MIHWDGVPTYCTAVCVCTLLMVSLKDLRDTLGCGHRWTRTLHLYSRSVESSYVGSSFSGQGVHEDLGLLQRNSTFRWGKSTRLIPFTRGVQKRIPASLNLILLQVLHWCWGVCFLILFFIRAIRRCGEIINSVI